MAKDTYKLPKRCSLHNVRSHQLLSFPFILILIVSMITPTSADSLEIDSYQNEFSNPGETVNTVAVITYIPHATSLSEVAESLNNNDIDTVYFNKYCSGPACVIVPVDASHGRIYDMNTMNYLFKSRVVIGMADSGELTEDAYTFQQMSDLCELTSINLLRPFKTNTNNGGISEIGNYTKDLRTLKQITSSSSPLTLITSATCTLALNQDDIVFKNIAAGGIYLKALRSSVVYHGIIEHYQISNKEAIDTIESVKTNPLANLHDIEQMYERNFSSPVKIADNCIKGVYNRSPIGVIKGISNCLNLTSNDGSAISSKTNIETFNEKLPLITANYNKIADVSTISFQDDGQKAYERITFKSRESAGYIEKASNELNTFTSQIPLPFMGIISNIILSPSIDYDYIRQLQIRANNSLISATIDHNIYRFNSATQHSQESMRYSEQGIGMLNKPQNPNWANIFFLVFVFMFVIYLFRKPT